VIEFLESAAHDQHGVGVIFIRLDFMHQSFSTQCQQVLEEVL
jgi:hypothetical protein